jgi:membrane protein DedA with SNARE-associated domain
LEQIAEYIISLDPFWIYFFAIAIAYTENIFPPFPSDVILVAAGYICALGRVDFWIVLLLSTLGSMLGFMTMYKIGSWFGMKIIETGRFRFISMEKIHRVENWFSKYGYLVVVVNRFLAGTRAVISFFTGLSNLPLFKTVVLASISSFVWNTILLYAGKSLGTNWKSISTYLEAYGRIVIFASVIIILFFILKNLYSRRKSRDT